MGTSERSPSVAGGGLLLAATANVHGLILATRNVGDLAEVSVRVTNPFDFAME